MVVPCNPVTDGQGRELTPHGSTEFPIAIYSDDLGAESVPWHWHDEFEALVVTEGCAELRVDSERFVLEAGEGCFINGGALHRLEARSEAGARLHSVVFHPRLVGGGIDSLFWRKYVGPFAENRALRQVSLRSGAAWQAEALTRIQDAWSACVREAEGFEFDARAALSRLIFLLHRQAPGQARRASEKELRDGERGKRMLQFIQAHCAEALRTADIARSAAISESECLRCFRSTIGAPPIEYLRQYRVQKAAALLEATEMKIVDVGLRCGFQNSSYFIKTFRAYRGCTPAEYRQRAGQDAPEDD